MLSTIFNRSPRRIKYEHHKIDRNNIASEAMLVCKVLYSYGYEAFLVGGAVRDLMLGLKPKDFDVVTNATPKQIQSLFRHSRIVGRRFQLVHVVLGKRVIETSTFRAVFLKDQDVDKHGRVLRDNVFGTQKEDAARRDFTINSLYYDPKSEEVVDYHSGIIDLKKRSVRTIGNPKQRYREDPARILRAVRFAARIRGTIDKASLESIEETAYLIKYIHPSRLFDEVFKLLTCGHATSCLNQLKEFGFQPSLVAIPLLNAVLKTEDRRFIELVLAYADTEVQSGRGVKPSFMLAALLWQRVKKCWIELYNNGLHSTPALVQAGNSTLKEQTQNLFIQRQVRSDAREIWLMQPRFRNYRKKSVCRLVKQPRFRAAHSLLKLRANFGECDIAVVDWWMDLANSNLTRNNERNSL